MRLTYSSFHIPITKLKTMWLTYMILHTPYLLQRNHSGGHSSTKTEHKTDTITAPKHTRVSQPPSPLQFTDPITLVANADWLAQTELKPSKLLLILGKPPHHMFENEVIITRHVWNHHPQNATLHFVVHDKVTKSKWPWPTSQLYIWLFQFTWSSHLYTFCLNRYTYILSLPR